MELLALVIKKIVGSVFFFEAKKKLTILLAIFVKRKFLLKNIDTFRNIPTDLTLNNIFGIF